MVTIEKNVVHCTRNWLKESFNYLADPEEFQQYPGPSIRIELSFAVTKEALNIAENPGMVFPTPNIERFRNDLFLRVPGVAGSNLLMSNIRVTMANLTARVRFDCKNLLYQSEPKDTLEQVPSASSVKQESKKRNNQSSSDEEDIEEWIQVVQALEGDDDKGETSLTVTVRPSETKETNKVPSSDHEENECWICLDRRIDMVFVPCGHAICCRFCPKLQECPKCRQTITQSIRLYIG